MVHKLSELTIVSMLLISFVLSLVNYYNTKTLNVRWFDFDFIIINTDPYNLGYSWRGQLFDKNSLMEPIPL